MRRVAALEHSRVYSETTLDAVQLDSLVHGETILVGNFGCRGFWANAETGVAVPESVVKERLAEREGGVSATSCGTD